MAAMHTTECERLREQRTELQARFDREHPDHCRACDGVGATFWSDPDVGIFSVAEPCSSCEGHPTDPKCGLCGRPGDFSDRLHDGSADDQRPCLCDTASERPPVLECGCWLDETGLAALPETVTPDRPYDYAADDRAFDEARDREATRGLRGRD